MIDALGPVSRTLEAELRTWVSRQGVILWLDLDRHYGDFVQELAALKEEGRLSYDLFSFRGSHLELMLELEQHIGGIDRPRLVIHLPGFREESIKETPLLELYAAGARFRRGLGTLVAEAAAGQVPPEEVHEFVQQTELTLAEANAWLTARLSGGDDELVARLRAMSMPTLVDDLLRRGEVSQRLGLQVTRDAVKKRMEAAIGMRSTWFNECVPSENPGDEDYAFALASWALCVEYVDDLRRLPVAERLAGIRDLPRKTTDDCCSLAQHLRTAHPDFYARTADETEARLTEEVDVAKAEDLGQIDTFRFEDDKVLEESLAALDAEQYNEALEWADHRLDGGSFWLKQAPSRRSAWELCRDAAKLGLALAAASKGLGARNLSMAVERYLQLGVEVDLRHRHLEQLRATLLYAQIPEFELLRDMLDSMRQRWRHWADGWARDFNRLCLQEGFLPPDELQQRELFDQVVRPLCQEPGTTALFMVDALRYEMATELFAALDGTPASTVRLDARLAELPTVTAIGMNALAPVSQGGVLRLVLNGKKIGGISSSEFRVATPETRQRAMHLRVGGTTCPLLSLNEVMERDGARLKKTVARANLVLVHSKEIDDAGEKGAGPNVFQQVLQKLRAAWRLLREAGVRRFVITADHGFLLLDPTAGRVQPHGRKIDPSRRHVFSDVAADHQGEVRVDLADLRYSETAGHVMFPETTAVFDTGKRRKSFVHGGNSLQERVIPVLTVIHRAAAGGSTQRYKVEAEGMEGVAGMHCLSAAIKPVSTQTSLDFGGVKELELDLGVVEASELPGGVQVELCHTRGAASLSGGAVVAQVGQRFELFFRLLGGADARVQVVLGHSGAQANVISGTVDRRYPVAPDGQRVQEPGREAGVGTRAWLEQLPEGGVRQVFDHLAAHGKVTEQDAVGMLGSPRALRRFTLRFEEYAAVAPFSAHIEVANGIKRYVRQGSEQ